MAKPPMIPVRSTRAKRTHGPESFRLANDSAVDVMELGSKNIVVTVSSKPPMRLDEIWFWIMLRWVTLPRVLDAVGPDACGDDCGEEQIRSLCDQCVPDRTSAEGATNVLLRYLKSGIALRHLDTFGQNHFTQRQLFCTILGQGAPRQRFSNWSSNLLLLFNDIVSLPAMIRGDGHGAPRNGGSPLPSSSGRERSGQVLITCTEFVEFLVLMDVHLEDALAWFQELSDPHTKMLDAGVLSRRLLAQPTLELDGAFGEDAVAMASPDLTVRLVYVWGDLTTAFSLRPRHTAAVPPKGRVSAKEMASVQSVSSRGPGLPSLDQWARALRGSKDRPFMSTAEAKVNAARQDARHRARSAAGGFTFASLFPNLSERLCLARTTFLPHELVVARYSTLEYGFHGAGVVTGSVCRPALGAQPFVAVVPLESGGGLPSEIPDLRAMIPLGERCGAVMLRAPCRAQSGGPDGLWAVQLFASNDGSRPIAAVGSPVPIRVMAQVSRPPGSPELVQREGSALTVTWSMPWSDGGCPILGHEVGLWMCGAGPVDTENTEPFCSARGRHVWPPFRVVDLPHLTEFVLRVRCETEMGFSSWSDLSPPSITLSAEPPEMAPPQVIQVTVSSAKLRWETLDGEVDSYSVAVLPEDGDEPLAVMSISPPPRQEEDLRSGHKAGTEVDINGLAPNSLYRFTVCGVNTSGSGPASVPSAASRTGPAPPDAPGAPFLAEEDAAQQTSMMLSWESPLDDGGAAIVRYIIRGVKDPDQPIPENCPEVLAPPVDVQTRDASTRLLVKKLLGNTRYVFTVYALNQGGLSGPSPPSRPLSTAAVQPMPPYELRAIRVEATRLALEWEYPADDGGSGVQLYHVEVVERSSSSKKATVSTARFGVVVECLRGNFDYVVRVRTETAVGMSEPAELRIRTGPVLPHAPRPPHVSGTPGATEATLIWAPPSDDGGAAVSSYILHVHSCGSAAWPDTDAMSSMEVCEPQSSVAGLAPNSRYRFRLQAKNSVGLGAISDWSNEICTMPPPLPSPQPPILVAATARTLMVTWTSHPKDPDNPPQEYEVSLCAKALCEDAEALGLRAVEDFSTEGKPAQAHLRVCRPPAQFKGLERFTCYSFRARVRGLGGWSSWSDPSEPHKTSDDWSNEEIADALMLCFGTSLAEVFRALDTNCDGFMSEADVVRGLHDAGLCVPEPRRRTLFSEMDAGQRGYITLREFTKCLSQGGSDNSCGGTRRVSPGPVSRASSPGGLPTQLQRRSTLSAIRGSLSSPLGRGRRASVPCGATPLPARRPVKEGTSPLRKPLVRGILRTGSLCQLLPVRGGSGVPSPLEESIAAHRHLAHRSASAGELEPPCALEACTTQSLDSQHSASTGEFSGRSTPKRDPQPCMPPVQHQCMPLSAQAMPDTSCLPNPQEECQDAEG